jgi:hypothetical protein
VAKPSGATVTEDLGPKGGRRVARGSPRAYPTELWFPLDGRHLGCGSSLDSSRRRVRSGSGPRKAPRKQGFLGGRASRKQARAGSNEVWPGKPGFGFIPRWVRNRMPRRRHPGASASPAGVATSSRQKVSEQHSGWGSPFHSRAIAWKQPVRRLAPIWPLTQRARLGCLGALAARPVTR